MNFGISEEQQMLRDAVRDALGRECVDSAAYWSIFCELGLTGICLPESSSGVGLDASALAVVGEEVGAVTPGMGTALMLHNAMVCAVQEAYGSDPAVQQHIADLAHGATAGALGLAPAIGLPVLQFRGVETLALLADQRESSRLVKVEEGTESAAPCFDGLMWTAETRPWVSVADGPALVLPSPLAMIGLGAVGLGAARASFEAAVLYSTERKQFGQPISQFQAIQWMLADSNAELDAARLLVRQAAAYVSTGHPDARRLAEQAALSAAEAALAIADRAIQIHGGYGYTREYAVERFWRDAQQLLMGCLGGGDEIRRRAGAMLAERAG